MDEKIVNAMLRHAEKEYPNESCGVVVKLKTTDKYIPCKNIAKDPTTGFKMCPESYAKAEDIGDVIGIVHSHPDGTTVPSAHDLAIMSVNREIELAVNPNSDVIPWHIVSWPEGDYRQIDPVIHGDLLGKPFVHGVWDCWQSCADFYKKHYGIDFPHYEREDLWWEKKDGPSHYEDFYESAGFYIVSEPEYGDMIVMQVGHSYHPNHAGIYLGSVTEFDGTPLGGNGPFMFHHMYNKKSEVVVYGGQWSQRTRLILRHKNKGV
jgi:proteasome lid subunit RPN8/RPN11